MDTKLEFTTDFLISRGFSEKSQGYYVSQDAPHGAEIYVNYYPGDVSFGIGGISFVVPDCTKEDHIDRLIKFLNIG